MLNIAVVGLGGTGYTHGGVYDQHPQCKLVAVCDTIRDKANTAAERYNCQAFYSVAEMLDSRIRIDTDSVCTAGEENGGHHYAPTMALLHADIPFLGGKPISNKIPEAREMVALAKEKGLRFVINLNHRFTTVALKAKT